MKVARNPLTTSQKVMATLPLPAAPRAKRPASQTSRVGHKQSLCLTPRPASPLLPAVLPPEGVRTRDSDPIAHIEFLASDALEGRNSPSEGLNKAAAHIAGLCQKYGVKGPNPTDPQSPYYQTFSLWGVAGDTRDPADIPAPGPELFEYGIFIDHTTRDEDIRRLLRFAGKNGKTPLLNGPSGIQSLTAAGSPITLQGEVQNVLGLVEGTGPHKDEVIVVMAHYDHVGKSRYSGIYSGADDNASGSAVALSLVPKVAELRAKGQLDRSVLFLWTAAEEKGLVGAEYFARHPIAGIDLDAIEGVINLDMVGRFAPNHFSLIDETDGKPNKFRAMVEAANRELAVPFEHVNRDIKSYSSRLDGWVFAKRKEDVLNLYEGLSKPTGGGRTNPDYHRTTDTLEAMLKENGGEKVRRMSELAAGVVKLAANPGKSRT